MQTPIPAYGDSGQKVHPRILRRGTLMASLRVSQVLPGLSGPRVQSDAWDGLGSTEMFASASSLIWMSAFARASSRRARRRALRC